MKICVVQTRPVRGDIQTNIENHKKLLDAAIAKDADVIIFPELSITGYEPELADKLATEIDDPRFDVFQEISNSNQVTIGVGMPIRNNAGITISMILFRPNAPRHLYNKKYIHPDEERFFVSGQNENGIVGEGNNIALSICYELSVPAHAENAHKNGAEFYISSSVKSKNAMQRTMTRLSEIAKNYSMIVLFANCVGESGGYDCGGKSSIFTEDGELLTKLNDVDEGFLIINIDNNTL